MTEFNDAYTFTSESVSDGHPDKIADQISDAILDYCLLWDQNSRVAVETLVKGNNVILAGEINTSAPLGENMSNLKDIVRMIYQKVGHREDSPWGINPNDLNIQIMIDGQSEEINHGVSQEKTGAGDQGIMFGYATNETPEMMPLALTLATKIMLMHKSVRSLAGIPQISPDMHELIGPDAKSQVTLKYTKVDGVYRPTNIDTIVFSTQHSQEADLDWIRKWGREFLHICLADYAAMITDQTKFLINPAGTFHVGGPIADAGLTGRKIVVDTYGGKAPHGGGAFSGKDPTKVDRSAAYAARRFAKWLMKNYQTDQEVLVQLSYAIGNPHPVGIYLNGIREDRIDLIQEYCRFLNVDDPFSPDGMINSLNLRRPIYEQTASFGHFGHPNYVWEQV